MIRILIAPLLALALLGCEAPAPRFVPSATQVRSHAEDERNEAYFAGPWPDDRRLINGAVSTRRFPRPGTGSLIDNLLASGDRVARGWGLSAPLYVPFTQAIDVESLPASAALSSEAGASVVLTAVDPSSKAFGRRHPIDFHFFASPTLYLPGNILAVRPVPGFPLEAKTSYALIVTTRVKDQAGAAVGPEETLWNVLEGKESDPYYAPLTSALAALQLSRSEVAGAFLFTTQSVVDEVLVLRDYLESQPNPSLDHPKLAQSLSNFDVFEGTYRAPNLQHGVVPYALTGGEFRFDAAGVPIPSEIEEMRVALCVPRGPVPPGGFPLVLYSHGTGGHYQSVIRDICPELAQVGIAAAGIDQVFHGPRGKGANGCFGQEIEVCFFNPINVVAGRNNTRQAALDNVMLRKMLAQATLPASLDPQGRTLKFSAQSVGFFGHSQGGLTGAVYAGFETHLAGAVLSGAGGHLTTTVLVRKDPINVRALAEGPLILGIEGKESLDPYHPMLALMQALADVADPASYGRYWIARPEGQPKHLYLTSGMLDPYTSAFTAEVLAASASIPQLMPIGEVSPPHLLAGLAPVQAPVQDNVTSDTGAAVTAVFRQFPGEGHFPVFSNPSARRQWVAFFDKLLHGSKVVVVSP